MPVACKPAEEAFHGARLGARVRRRSPQPFSHLGAGVLRRGCVFACLTPRRTSPRRHASVPRGDGRDRSPRWRPAGQGVVTSKHGPSQRLRSAASAPRAGDRAPRRRDAAVRRGDAPGVLPEPPGRTGLGGDRRSAGRGRDREAGVPRRGSGRRNVERDGRGRSSGVGRGAFRDSRGSLAAPAGAGGPGGHPVHPRDHRSSRSGGRLVHRGVAVGPPLQPGEALLHGRLQHPHRNLRMTFRGEPLALALAGTLRHAWRPGGEAFDLPAIDRGAWAERLVAGGVGALAWWRIRQTALAAAPEASALQEAFRFHAVSAARNERDLRHLVGHFNDAGIEPILFKGWTLARLYPHKALRPFGDFDLLVPREQTERARAVLRELGDDLRERADVDTAETLARYLPDRTEAELFGSAQPESFEGARFKVLCPEDHLRLVTLHQLHHGGWRPLWLCDVAVLLEAIPAEFSWERCLRGEARLSEGVLATIALAAELLGARMPSGTPEFVVPVWLRRAVLHGWVHGYE